MRISRRADTEVQEEGPVRRDEGEIGRILGTLAERMDGVGIVERPRAPTASICAYALRRSIA